MRALLVSGIWPPDIGGPASHAPELAGFLLEHGHAVEVVTTAQEPPAPESYAVRFVRRSLLPGLRHAAVALLVARRARAADVVYATSMTRRAAVGARLAERPLVLKLTADEVYERERRTGRYAGGLDSFQRHRGGLRVALLRWTRNAAVRRASHVFVPSDYLRGLVLGWGIDGGRVSVLPNPAPRVPPLPAREELRGAFSLDGPVVVFAGRLMAAKALDVALEALARLPGVTLVVVGDGPDRDALERRCDQLGLDGRVRFLGGRPREEVLRLLRAADAAVLSSRWESFPHSVLEALAVGTPVVATSVGGVPEVVHDGDNGLLVPPDDPDALAAALRRIVEDRSLRERLAQGAIRSAAAYEPERLLGRVAAELERVASR